RLYAFARLDLDGHDFLDEAAFAPGLVGELLAAQRVAVLIFAADAVLRGAVLGRHRHGAAAVRIEQRFPQVVFELALPELEAGPKSADHVRRLAHALDAAGEHEARLAKLDHLRPADRRLDTRSPQPVDGQRGHVDWHAGLERNVTRAVDRVGARLEHVADDGVIDPLGLDAGFLKGAARGDRPQFESRHVLQRPDVVGHRSARAAK